LVPSMATDLVATVVIRRVTEQRRYRHWRRSLDSL
jgi:ribosomal protein L39E